MKRVATDSLNRNDFPRSVHSPEPMPSDQPGTGSPTHEQLRQSPVPPFPPDVDFSTSAIAGRWADQGTSEQISKEDTREFALFCLQHRYADALRWMVLRHDMATLCIARGNITNDDLLWLIDWADSLPSPINLDLRENRIDVSADDVALAIAHSSKLRANTSLTTLAIDLPEKDVEALHRYLRENRSLGALCLRRPANEPAHTRLNPARALLTNKILSRIELDGWRIDADLAKSLFTAHETLASICFSRCVFEGDGTAYALLAIASTHTLSVLEFRDCNLDPDTQIEVINALKSNRSLTRLTFGTGRLHMRVLLAMEAVLQTNTTLLHFPHNVETGDAHIDPEDEAQCEVAKAIERRLEENREISRACQHSLLENLASCPSATGHTNPQAGNSSSMAKDNPGRLVLPPFPARINFNGTSSEIAANWALCGMPEEVMPSHLWSFATYCVHSRCADALTWMVRRHGMKTLSIVDDDYLDTDDGYYLDTDDFLWLMAWIERLAAPGVDQQPCHLVLSLEAVDLSDHDVADAVARSRNLISFDASSSTHTYRHSLSYFFEKLAENTVLTELAINIQFPDDLKALSQYLHKNRTLVSLGLYDQRRKREAGWSLLLPGLLADNKLASMKLVCCDLDPILIAALFAPGKELKKIRFESCEISYDAAMAIAEAIASSQTLSTIEFVVCEFKDEDQDGHSRDGSIAIINALKFNHSITTFTLRPIEGGHIKAMHEVLQANTTLLKVVPGLEYQEDTKTRHRLLENREITKFSKHYPLAEQAFAILPGGGLPALPLEVSQKIVRMLPAMGPSALHTYRTLHRLASHRHSQAQATPPFPADLDLVMEPFALELARRGRKALPMPPTMLERVVAFCIEQQASEALDWLVVHAPLGELRLGQGANTEEELRWLMKWARSAPSRLKLRLDGISLSEDMIAILARQLRHHPIVTALSLRRCAIDPGHLPALLDALRFNTALRELALPAELWSSELLEDIKDLLQHNRTLLRIDIGRSLGASPDGMGPDDQLLSSIFTLLMRNRSPERPTSGQVQSVSPPGSPEGLLDEMESRVLDPEG